MKTLSMILSLLTLASSAYAGDAANIKNLGFSADNKYYAFAQYGTGDGSGFAYASVSVIDVAKNTIASSKFVMIEDESGTEKAALAKAVKEVNLGKFGIVAGKNLGVYLVNRTVFDHSDYANTRFALDYAAEGGASMPLAKFEAVLELKNMEDKTDGKWCTDMSENGPKGFKLSIAGLNDSGISHVLQDDKTLPSSRGCALGYNVKQVIRNGKSLVVMVSYSSVGFEGPDYRFIAVSGTPAL